MNDSLRRLVLAVAAAGVCACGSDEITGGGDMTPSYLQIVAGNNQTGTTLSTLRNRLIVAVTNRAGVPVRGVPVEWTVTVGGGSVSQQSTFSDSKGEASVVWTLGPQSETQSVTASTGAITEAVEFSAIAWPAPIRMVLR